jgi:hypothetical protein
MLSVHSREAHILKKKFLGYGVLAKNGRDSAVIL